MEVYGQFHAPGGGAISPELKREDDYSSPTTAEVNAWSYTSIPHTSSWCGA